MSSISRRENGDTMPRNLWVPSEAANEASDYFNSLPREQKARLVPLLEEYRRRGHIEAREIVTRAVEELDAQRRLVDALIERSGVRVAEAGA
jgi:hypothetical protein